MEDETQKGLSFSGALVREKAMTVGAHLETMSDLKKVVLFLDGFPVHLEDLEGKIGNILILTH